MMEHGIRLDAIGRIDGIPRFVQDALAETKAITAGNRKMTLCLALNYGGRLEIVDAARRLAADAAAGRIAPDAIDEAALEARLYQPAAPPLALLVRTAGEQRVSNFLLWQLSARTSSTRCWPSTAPASAASAAWCGSSGGADGRRGRGEGGPGRGRHLCGRPGGQPQGLRAAAGRRGPPAPHTRRGPQCLQRGPAPAWRRTGR